MHASPHVLDGHVCASEAETPAPPRRTVLVGALGAVLGAALVLPAEPATAAARSGRSRRRWRDIGKAARVPVGSARLFRRSGWVVTQPEPGTYHAFSALCPHQRCAQAMARLTPADVAGDPRITTRPARRRGGRVQVRA